MHFHLRLKQTIDFTPVSFQVTTREVGVGGRLHHICFLKNNNFSLTGKQRTLRNVPVLPTCGDLQTGMCAPAQAHTRASSPVTLIFVLHQHTLTGLQEDMFVFCFPTGARYSRRWKTQKRTQESAWTKQNRALENVTAFVLRHKAGNNSCTAALICAFDLWSWALQGEKKTKNKTQYVVLFNSK